MIFNALFLRIHLIFIFCAIVIPAWPIFPECTIGRAICKHVFLLLIPRQWCTRSTWCTYEFIFSVYRAVKGAFAALVVELDALFDYGIGRAGNIACFVVWISLEFLYDKWILCASIFDRLFSQSRVDVDIKLLFGLVVG